MNCIAAQGAGQIIGLIDGRQVVGLDIATSVFQFHRAIWLAVQQPGPWLEHIKARRPPNVVIVAQAAKMARTIWAVTARQQDYQRGHHSTRPQAV